MRSKGKPFTIHHNRYIWNARFLTLCSTLFFYRDNNQKEVLCSINLLNSCNSNLYEPFWNICSYINTYNNVRKSGTYLKKSRRGIAMYLFGSTIGATRFPLYYKDNSYHNLPRPYCDFKPGLKARQYTDSKWFTTFVQDIEKCVIYFLREMYPDKKKAKLTLFKIAQAKKMIPHNCRISGTFFNHMTFLGNLNRDCTSMIDVHKDDEDIITALFHLGKPKSGGNTNFYSGDSKEDPGKLIYTTEFQHGRLQIGFFDNVLHSASGWEGYRGGINLNLKKNVLKFFNDPTLSKFYNKYESDGFPSSNYIAI